MIERATQDFDTTAINVVWITEGSMVTLVLTFILLYTNWL